MVVYLDILLILNFFVDFFLLLGTNRLAGYPPKTGKAALAAALGAAYGAVCLIPGFSFLGSFLWRTVCLMLMGIIAFGFTKSAVRRCVLFYLLSMALGGVALGIEGGNAVTLIAAAGGVGALCFFGFRGKLGKTFLPVELRYGEKILTLTALRDTGNSLRDPLTGQSVLIISPEAAEKLTGLTPAQLRDPAGSITALPGMCLVPYRAVGKQGGVLLALRLKNVKIGPYEGKCTVAFAPEGLGGNGEYDALTGGSI